MGIFLQWPGWPSRHIDRIAAAGLESYGSSARNTYTGYACEGSIHLSDKAPNLARRTGMPAAPPIVHKIVWGSGVRCASLAARGTPHSHTTS